MADPGKFNDWTAVFATLGSVAIALVSVTIGCWNWIRRAIRAVKLSDDWHTWLGDRPVDARKEIDRVVQRCTSIAEIQRELLSERMGLGFFVSDPMGEWTWTNGVLRSMFESDSEDMRGFKWLSKIVEATEAHTEWLNCVGRQIPYRHEYSVRRSDGDKRARARAFACVTNRGELLAFVGYVEWVD